MCPQNALSNLVTMVKQRFDKTTKWLFVLILAILNCFACLEEKSSSLKQWALTDNFRKTELCALMVIFGLTGY